MKDNLPILVTLILIFLAALLGIITVREHYTDVYNNREALEHQTTFLLAEIAAAMDAAIGLKTLLINLSLEVEILRDTVRDEASYFNHGEQDG